MPAGKHKQFGIWGVLLLGVWLALVGCQDGDKVSLSPAARKFQGVLRQELKLLARHLAPLAATEDQDKCQAALKRLFDLAIGKGDPLMYGIVILDSEGVVLTGRYPAQDHPEGVPDLDTSHNYSHFKIINQSLHKGRTGQGVIYVSEGHRYIVSHPLEHQGRRVGVLILGFYPPMLEDKLGVSQEEFLALDLGS